MDKTHNNFTCFIDRQTNATLNIDHKKAFNRNYYFNIENGVIDFYNRQKKSNSKNTTQNIISPLNKRTDDSAPELRESHDKAFAASEDAGENGNIYGTIHDLPKITQSGHFRRMELLNNIKLTDIEEKTAVDFGTGPWGFGAIFPQLHKAKFCIGFDVSKIALLLARKATPLEIDSKTLYGTTDGDFIPLASDCVDIFFGGEVIEHVRNPKLFLQEIARVCKDNATVILTTPNKDALNYRVFQQQYCVGPEHIALMSCNEFKEALETFCHDVSIFGYETSLSPEMDLNPLDSSTLKSIQLRAEKYPELSTGMVSFSKVSKKLFSKNKRELTLKEYLWNSKSIKYLPQLNGHAVNLFDNIEGYLLSEGMIGKIPISGKEISLLFWGHDWSGVVEISCGDNHTTTDLYSSAGGYIRINIINENMATELTFRQTGNKRDVSASSQVIFYKLIEYI